MITQPKTDFTVINQIDTYREWVNTGNMLGGFIMNFFEFLVIAFLVALFLFEPKSHSR